MKQWAKRYLPLFLALLLCVGCGKVPGGSEGGNGGKGPGVVTTEGDSGRTYRVEQTLTVTIEDPDTSFSNKTVYSSAYGSTLYLLVSYRLEDGTETSMWMYTFDLNTMETEKIPFTLEAPGMENPSVYTMTVTGQDELVLRLYGSLVGSAASSYLYRSDLTGKPLDEENPLSEDLDYPPLSGRFVTSTDGSAFLAEVDSGTTSLSCYEAQSQRQVPLASVNGFVNALCSDGQDGLYYVDSSRLRHLNLNDMTEEILCNTTECGIKLSYENWLLSDGEGKLALCAVSDSCSVIYMLTDEEETPEQAATAERETIRMARLYLYDRLVDLAHNWSALSDNYSMVVEEIPLEEEMKTSVTAEQIKMFEPLRTRIMAELVSGNGPDLMIVSRDDMHILAEKGALMDLSEVIPEDIQEQLLPGMRPMGTVDGMWVGITVDVYYYTLMTSNSLWSEEGWTVSDMLDVAESKEDWGDWILGYDLSKPDYYDLFDFGFSESLGDSPFMDVENGISYFNSEEFIRVLEFCKKYGQPSNKAADSYDALNSMLREGKSLAKMTYLYSGLHGFSKAMASRENCHMVGFPSEKGSGNYMYAETFLVVNANTEHIDAVKDYIAYIFSYDIQFALDTPVRKDAIRDQVGDDPDIYPTPYTLTYSQYFKKNTPWPLEGLKPDGTTYLEEYMEFVENCEPVPYCPDAISEIVKEEIGAYFTGDRSAEDTANIIYRRVQLYFDERG